MILEPIPPPALTCSDFATLCGYIQKEPHALSQGFLIILSLDYDTTIGST